MTTSGDLSRFDMVKLLEGWTDRCRTWCLECKEIPVPFFLYCASDSGGGCDSVDDLALVCHSTSKVTAMLSKAIEAGLVSANDPLVTYPEKMAVYILKFQLQSGSAFLFCIDIRY